MSYPQFIVLGYVLGSVLFCYYLPLWFRKIDVTKDTPDGNPGAFNCIAKAGRPLGLFALLCDLLKGAVPVFLAAHAVDIHRWPFALVVAAPVVGHAFPLFRRLRGGKAIAVSFGVTIGLLPMWGPFALLAACYLFFTLVVQIRPHRHRSIVTFLCFGVGSFLLFRGTPAALGCLLSALVVILRHWGAEPNEERVSARLGSIRREK